MQARLFTPLLLCGLTDVVLCVDVGEEVILKALEDSEWDVIRATNEGKVVLGYTCGGDVEAHFLSLWFAAFDIIFHDLRR